MKNNFKRRNKPGGEVLSRGQIRDAKAKERCFFGVNAIAAILQSRPSTVRKLIIDRSCLFEYKELIELAEESRVAVGDGTTEELDKIAGSIHHQGVCLLGRAHIEFSFEEALPGLRKSQALLYLDGVGNPHNLGAILRTAAHFGFEYILGPQSMASLSPSAVRTAEGAAEHVRIVRVEQPRSAFERLRKEGFKIIAAERGGEAKPLGQTPLPARSLLVLGNEVEGLSPEARESADLILEIPGTGIVDSLNVAASAAIFLYEWQRGRGAPAKK
jgi:TrmH RNA methyltransferase